MNLATHGRFPRLRRARPRAGRHHGERIGRLLVLWGVIACATPTVRATDDAPTSAASPAAVGRRWDLWVVRGVRYETVEVRAVSARTVTILHAGGLSSLALRDLDADLQVQLGYDVAREQVAEAQAAAERAAAQERLEQLREDRARRLVLAQAGPYEELLQRFGQPPGLRSEVNLRATPAAQALEVKNQGRRPSCSVFAVVSALELQHALLTGRAERFSEEYLIWATRQLVQRAAPTQAELDAEAIAHQSGDAGFTLVEVVTALRAYGIPPESAMPNTFGVGMSDIRPPSAAVVAEAQERRRVFVHPVPGRDADTAVANIVHALNTGVPVVVGVRWPHERTIRGGALSEQAPVPGYAHAVTLVGYRCPTGVAEETVFVFKNSYGVRWGQGGYGQMTFRYLRERLMGAVFLEIQDRI